MLKYYKLKSCFMFNNCLQPNVIKILSRRYAKTSLAKLCSNCKHLAIVLWSFKNLLIELAAWLWVLWLLATTSYDIQGLRMFVQGERWTVLINVSFCARCYSFAEMPWYQRKIAAMLFATPPTSTYQEVQEENVS